MTSNELLRPVQRSSARLDSEPPPTTRRTGARRSVRRIPIRRTGFCGVLRPGSHVVLRRPLRCGEVVFPAGTVAIVTQLFPKLRLRATTAPHHTPVNVSFEELVDAAQILPTTRPPTSTMPPPSSAVSVDFAVSRF